METEKTEGAVDTTNNEGEVQENQVDTVSIPKSDYEKLNQTLGSLKREIKDLKKPKEETRETSKTNQADVNPLAEKIEKMALKQAGITHPEDIELARKTAKKWNMDIDDVLSDEDFQTKLGRQQNNRSNLEATTSVKGGTGSPQAKFTTEYWKAKGRPPMPDEVGDRKVRAKIAREMMSSGGNGKKFYND